MKTKITSLWLVLSIIFSSAMAEKLPSQKEVLDKMVLANAYFMNKWPDPGIPIVTDKTRPSNIWTRAVYYEGLMALYQLKPDKTYYDYAVSWGESHKWGLNGGIQTRNADSHCCGQTYVDLYLIDKKPERITDIKASVDLMLESSKKDDWTWIDALQMAMPVYAKLGVLYNDNRYYERMYEMYMVTKTVLGGNGLYNPKDKLWWRDKDFVAPYKEPNGEDCYWSRGNGWVVAALVRVLEIMPKDATHRDEYQNTLEQMVEALIPIQRKDGYWNASLHDPNNFGGKELSGTALFTYGMAWGVNHGILSKKKYLPVIKKAWNAMSKESVHPNGFLGWVQGTGKQPSDSQPVSYERIPNFEDYGLGCFLLAGSEVYKLCK
ncbi:MAG: glycoside hydrolase family 88 protein [Bacteroidia bacterium]|nr:glycoside hydrolase family 88 protein [Bacteroidia bacterium]